MTATFNPGTVVWKYPLDLDFEATANLTFSTGTILRVDMQDGRLVAWVAVLRPEGHERITRRIVVAGTGRPIPDGPQVEYLNTFFSGRFVFHAFVGMPS